MRRRRNEFTNIAPSPSQFRSFVFDTLHCHLSNFALLLLLPRTFILLVPCVKKFQYTHAYSHEWLDYQLFLLNGLNERHWNDIILLPINNFRLKRKFVFRKNFYFHVCIVFIVMYSLYTHCRSVSGDALIQSMLWWVDYYEISEFKNWHLQIPLWKHFTVYSCGIKSTHISQISFS